MSISTDKDPLETALAPERVFYSVGALLGVEDFVAEQVYHRGRLATALSFLAGFGTVSGLKVEYKPASDEIVVHPGIAIDRLGRLIEVPADWCIRLDKWYGGQPAGDLVEAFHGAEGGVIVDVFVVFRSCNRALTPAFAAGPFDATDYVAPSRVRDAFQISLVLRKEGSPPLPLDPWPDLAAEADPAARRSALLNAIFDSFNAPAVKRGDDGQLGLLPEHVPGQDPAAIFLARFVIPAAAGSPPLRAPDVIVAQNEQRRFIYPVGALARWLGV